MNINENFVEKKLRGSGGYAIAKINDQEQKKANLGGPELFLAGIGRLDKERFVKYYCNRCEKEYKDDPIIEFENPNEDLGENVILIEKGEYRCKSCNYVIAQYRKFNEPKEEDMSNSKPNTNEIKTASVPSESGTATTTSIASTPNLNSNQKGEDKTKNIQTNSHLTGASTTGVVTNSKNTTNDSEYRPIEKMIGMPVYDSEANLVGSINEIGLRKILNQIKFSFKVIDSNKQEIKEITWDDISKIGDIIILKEKTAIEVGTENQKENANKICSNCNKENDPDSVFCEECGKKL